MTIIAPGTESEATRAPLEEAVVQAFESRLRGELLRPGHSAYDTARAVWNALIDRKPLLIARCTGTADIIESVNFARDHEIPLAVRGGGHNVAGHAVCEGGLVIDLSRMRGIHVDLAPGTARAQPGVNWGDLDRETQVFGLATPGSIVSAIGVAGLTLGGGIGWLSRKYGLTVDNLRSVDLVTAEGRCVTASETEHSDLFWGVRGGGGNFGVATSFEFELHPVGPAVMAGLVLYPMEQARDVLRFYREFGAGAPDKLGLLALLAVAPAAPFLPEPIRGQPVVGIAACYVGPLGEGERVMRPVKEFGNPILDLIAPRSYVEFQAMFDTVNPPGLYHYWRSDYLRGLTDAAIETAISYASRFSSPRTAVLFFRLGGAISHREDSSTAAGFRDAEYLYSIQSTWLEPQESDRHIRWTRGFWAAMRLFSMGGVYMNFISANEGEDRVRTAYGTNYDRLVALKNQYDPANLFRFNQNIRPTT